MGIQQLFPFPGAKSASKYDRYLYPPMDCNSICEPFMGSAATSIRFHWLKAYLGEINPAQREISLALQSPDLYCAMYQTARDRFWEDCLDYMDDVFAYEGTKNAQTRLSAENPWTYERLTLSWKELTADLYKLIQANDPSIAGLYAFCLRAAFGNVMRLTPSGAHFNISWHIDKLVQAHKHNPEDWLNDLRAINWNPTVLDCWQEAIAAVPDPSKCFLLLDPPYTCDHKTEKMTPCYVGHNVTTQNGHNETFNLAIDSLKAGLEREFSAIAFCNYYTDLLNDAVLDLISATQYSCTMHQIGECNALGNSNGRRKHGERVDQRRRPIEVIYRIEKVQKSVFFMSAKSENVQQLSLLGA